MESLLTQAKTELTEKILPYWMDKMTDFENGGFYGRITGENELIKEAPKAIILNTRILWTFSEAYNILQDEAYFATAQRAYDYLLKHFIDRKKGGVFWNLDYMGNPIDTKKQIYAQAFSIYALSAYYNATQEDEALYLAQELFGLIEKYSFDPIQNGYLEAFDKNWNLLEDLRLSDKDANEKKTMNTHLHILEAYTTLHQVWDDSNLKIKLENLIDLFLSKILNQDSMHFQLFFDEFWNLKSDTISFGHDIEGSWLLHEAAESLGNEKILKEVKQIALKMTDKNIAEGLDEDHGLFNELDGTGHLDTDKHWWPQTEAVVGYINAYQISKDKSYLNLATQTWEFISNKIIDQSNGEWHFRVNKAGKPYLEEDKAGPWKCPYHNGRACLEIIKRLG
ncbi:AGE family epimerase/isomerase [Flexithrix dorotheae]|uniref:AGE family epimerase/isomerase n=1 Tax=Flexithrix dorotheae TaxID=70993 RepID=UPI0003676D3B|nr:AGE family epimerase/isomerase [Flexithrix dorotheae]